MEKRLLSAKLIRFGVILCVMALMVAFSYTKHLEAKPANPVYGGTLRMGLSGGLVGLGYPPELRKYQDTISSRPALETLGHYNVNGKMEPWLAESWKVDPAAKTIIMKLRQGIKFHDGTDFNAKAVKWNLDQSKAEKAIGTRSIKSVDVVDNYTVRLNLVRWDNSIIAILGFYGAMISPKAFEKNGKDWCITHPVGTGPFKFVKWQRDVSIKYEKFDGYWQKGKPYLDGIELVMIVDPMTGLASFKAGELDILTQVPSREYPGLKASGKYEVTKLKTGNGASLWSLAGDSIHPDSVYSNLKVRQAVAHAIDKQAIVDALYHGTAIATNQWGPPGSGAYSSDVKGFSYNPAKAKQLLAEAGYPKGFKTKINTFSSPTAVALATALQAYLAKVGINAEIDPMEAGRFGKQVARGEWHNALTTLANRVDPNIAMQMKRTFGSTGFLYAKSLMHTKELDNSINQALSAHDWQTQTASTHKLQKMAYDKYVITAPLFVSGMINAKYPKVHNDGINLIEATQWTPEDTWLEK
ncbi:ABC transporter substrate-binding protein [Thermodesulfobacteriota bacterium]